MTINERIAMCIEKSGLTKTAFAERINLSQPHVSKLANGTSAPSDRTIADICREFGISETWLRTGEGAMIVPTDRDAEKEAFPLLPPIMKMFLLGYLEGLAEMAKRQNESTP